MHDLHEDIKYQSDVDIIFRLCHSQSSFVARHWHNSLEIIYLTNGSMECRLGDHKKRTLAAGDFIVINSREIHSFGHREPTDYLLLQIPYVFLKKYIPSADHLRFGCTPLDASQREACRQMREILSSIAALCPLASAGMKLSFYSLVFGFLFHLYTSFREEISPSEEEKSAKYIKRLGMVVSYVKEHYAENITLGEISSVVSLNPDYFTRFFRKYMGMTFLDYVNSIRLEYIHIDLQETDLSLQQLLDLHGFTNYKLFMQLYKSRFGCTPSQMRQRARRESSDP